MKTEKDVIKCESTYSDDREHRFSWKRVWNKDKPLACVIMLNPCHADNFMVDTTTALVVNNITRLEEYGGVEILNLYSSLTKKLNFKWNSDEELNLPDNDTFIKKAAEECAIVILAWGKSVANNPRSEERALAVINLLKDYKKNLFYISDGEKDGIHPLTPSLRNGWILKPLYSNSPASSENNGPV